MSPPVRILVLLAWTLLCRWHYRAFSSYCHNFHFYNLYVIAIHGQFFSLTKLNQQTEICSPLRLFNIIFLIFGSLYLLHPSLLCYFSSSLFISNFKIMTSGPITSWEIDGETVETVRLYFLGLQNHCRWWLQTWN